MSTYRVIWEIDIEADSPDEAARVAQAIQRDQDSTATCYTVVYLQQRVAASVSHIDLGESDATD